MTYDPPMFLKLNSVISLAISLTGTLVMYYMSVRAGLSVADYYAFNTAYGMVSGAFLSLAGIALSAAQIRPILTMVQPFFDAVPEVSDGKQVIERLSGGIELNNVSFRYNENMPLILDDLSLKIRPGQYVAIVGRTGCGKSTLLRLLLGFEKPQKGAIYYDGKDLERIDLRSLRRRIGVVPQKAMLFKGTIRSNLLWGNADATEADLRDALKVAQALDVVSAKSQGLDEPVEQGGRNFSGGQRQRLTIARALVRKPEILILDDSASALDYATDANLRRAIRQMENPPTTFIVSQRAASVRFADQIIVLDDGRVAGMGTHDELLAACPVYQEIYASQFKKEGN